MHETDRILARGGWRACVCNACCVCVHVCVRVSKAEQEPVRAGSHLLRLQDHTWHTA